MKKIIGVLLLSIWFTACSVSVRTDDKKPDVIYVATLYSIDGKIIKQYEGKRYYTSNGSLYLKQFNDEYVSISGTFTVEVKR